MPELEIGKYKYLVGSNLYCSQCELANNLIFNTHHAGDIGELYWLSECKCGARYMIRPTGFEVIDLNAPVV